VNQAQTPPLGAIFDCDGTLLDTMGLWRQMEAELAASAGHELMPSELDYLCACTLDESAAFSYTRLGVGESPRAVRELIDRMAADHYANRALPRPGVLEFLQSLRAAGVRCAVASSSPHSMLGPGLRGSGVGEYLDAVVSVEDVGASKREPAVYDRARELLGTPREATWVFEDAAYAVRTAKAGGYRTVAVWDCDKAGTLPELAELADVAVRDWRDLDAGRFLAGGYARG